MSKHILYFIHCYESNAGVENHMRDLANALKDRHEISIAFPTGGDSITVVRPGYGRLSFTAGTVQWPTTPYRVQATEKSIGRIVETLNPDIFHVQHFLHWPLSLYDQLLTYGRPVVASFHDYYAITPHLTLEGTSDPVDTLSSNYSIKVFGEDISTYLTERRRILSHSLARVNCCVVNSPYLLRVMTKVFPREFRIVEYGISPFNLNKRSSDGIFRFGYFGNLTPQKGWDLAVEAFTRLAQTNLTVELHLHGWHGQAKIRHVPGVTYHGTYDTRMLPELLAPIDVAIIPSRFAESFSIVLSELWMAGVAPIVADIGAMGERVIDGVNGKKFPPSNVEELETCMRWFLAHNEWRKWQFPRPRTVTEMANEYETLYNSLET